MPARILVVDDEPGIRDTLAAILGLAGYDVATARDGVDGFEQARTFQPHLIVSDVVMPNLDGVEMAMLVADHMPGIKILLISGQAVTKEILLTAQARGYDFECLTKPVPPPDLLRRIAELLAESSSEAQGA